jgi:hypothetical protein
MNDRRKERLERRGKKKMVKSAAAIAEGKTGKAIRKFNKGQKLLKKAMSGINYDDVYSTKKDDKVISEKRGERFIKKAKKKGSVQQTSKGPYSPWSKSTTTATKGRKTVTKIDTGDGSIYGMSKQQTNAGKKRRIKKINKKSKPTGTVAPWTPPKPKPIAKTLPSPRAFEREFQK